MAGRAGAPAPGRVLAAVGGAVHLAVGAGVLSVTAAGVPLMANAVSVDAHAAALAAVPVGAPASLGPAGLRAGPLWVPFDRTTRVGATVVGSWQGDPVRVDARGLRALADRLVGRGAGLTPEGDDLLAGVALALAARGREAEARLLVPPDADRRTTRLSACLLRLAARGHGPAAAVALLSAPDDAGRRAAAAELARLGASTGAALIRGMVAVLDGADLAALAPAGGLR